MDTSAPEVNFDVKGVCNFCKEFDETIEEYNVSYEDKQALLNEIVTEIKEDGKGKEYDCILGVSGGADSTYAAYVAMQQGLRALAVHLDNGWNSELAVNNIENLVTKFGFDLYTHVINWDEFRDLQLAFFKASVIDIEMLTDHAISAILYSQATKNDVKYIISGSNVVTEGCMPRSWFYKKLDFKNIKSIHKRYGTIKLKTFPYHSLYKKIYYMYIKRIKIMGILNYKNYHKEEAIRLLENEIGWRNYGGKHFESIFTRFYQGYILPEKFNVDKRKTHLSNLIRSGQITREIALEKINEEIYAPDRLKEDKYYVIKKLGLSEAEFDEYIASPAREHTAYPNYQMQLRILGFFKDIINKGRKFGT
jgi:N-acetyl sugar amidotransferase